MAPVNADQGLVIVPAGAGAGKTHRIKTQLSDWVKRGIVRPERTLAVTFTEAAAGELRERIRAGLLADGLVAEAMAVERLGRRPRLVEGREDNLKVTTPADLALAEFLLGRTP